MYIYIYIYIYIYVYICLHSMVFLHRTKSFDLCSWSNHRFKPEVQVTCMETKWNIWKLSLSVTQCGYYVCVGVPQPLQWRHNARDGVSNHLPRRCLLNRLFQRRSKKSRHWTLCGEFTGDQWFPAQPPSNVKNVFILWRHHYYAKRIFC